MQADIAPQALLALDGASIDSRLQGATLEDLPLKLRSQRVSGVLISELAPRSKLARNGLRPGDIINGVNRQRVNNLGEFQQVLADSGRSIYLQILRNGSIYNARID